VNIGFRLLVVLQKEFTALDVEDTLAPADLITGSKKEKEGED